ncbi:hypothetical protein ACS0TY_031692 [Phlomoides rotata]
MGRKKSKFRHRKPKMGKEIPVTIASSSAPQPPWIELPKDITANILKRLGAVEILKSAQKVCSTWRRVSHDPSMWRVIDLENPERLMEQYDLTCRQAVDRSQGQLVDLSLTYFGDDELINYVAYPSSDLKRLTLQVCSGLTGKGLVGAVKKLPLLEDLHLTIMPSIEAADVEAIGISCPMLKSFTFNRNGFSNPSVKYNLDEPNPNKYALAIAENMPNLCHLSLIGNSIDNEGLESILDGCSNLESLDLRQCFGLDLQQGLGKRCSKQIKHFKSPLDAVNEIKYLGAMYEQEDIDDYPYIDVFEQEDIDDYSYMDVFEKEDIDDYSYMGVFEPEDIDDYSYMGVFEQEDIDDYSYMGVFEQFDIDEYDNFYGNYDYGFF